jgi:hypothetical protein
MRKLCMIMGSLMLLSACIAEGKAAEKSLNKINNKPTYYFYVQALRIRVARARRHERAAALVAQLSSHVSSNN